MNRITKGEIGEVEKKIRNKEESTGIVVVGG